MSNKIQWSYGPRSYSVRYRASDSPYLGKCQMARSYDFLPYYSTIDDPVMKDIADQILEQVPDYADDAYIAKVLLAMVQQNIVYRSDRELYGLDDLWGLPITVLENRKGDCDCMTDLYVSIAADLDLDVVTVLVESHMFAAVRMDWDGVFYDLDGKRYYHMETTDEVPVAGRYWNEKTVEAWAKPSVPSEYFKSSLTFMK